MKRLKQTYGIVLRKEFRELLRDKRSLFWLFAPPIILPALALCAGVFIGTQALRIVSEGFPVWVQNADQAPELVERFESDEATYLVAPPSDPANNPFGDALILVVIPDNFAQQLTSGGAAAVEMRTRDNSIITYLGKGAVRSVIEGYSNALVEQRLDDRGLSRDWLTPITIGESQQVNDTVGAVNGEEGEDGPGLLATIFLPLAVTSWLVGGGIGLILDTTVGEKERQTIENLLVTPANRAGIVLGKLTVVFIASIAVMSLWMFEGILLNAISASGPALAEQTGLTPNDAIRIVLSNGNGVLGLVGALTILLIPFIVLLNGIVMAWSARAANYREGNLFMVLLQLGMPATILLTIFSLPPQVSLTTYAIPFLGTIVAIRDLFSNTLTTPGLLINFAAGAIYAGASVWLAAWVFNKEWSVTRGLQ